MIPNKLCTRCYEEKPLTEFRRKVSSKQPKNKYVQSVYNNMGRRNRFIYQPYCKFCESDLAKQSYKKKGAA